MNVLSLFDGMSCGQIALDQLNITVDNYFASEIDKHAIKVTQANYPNTIQIGDVLNVTSKKLPKIDLLIAGSPCQGFSFAGKQLNFEDQRSKLFFEFERLKNELRPKYFLLENVKMKKEYQDIISKYLEIEPILINSSLVSAQNRKRLYWTNIPNITQPKDEKIFLADIVENGIVDRYKSYCIDANYAKGGNPKNYFKKSRRQLVFHSAMHCKAPTVTTNKGEGTKIEVYQLNPYLESNGIQPYQQNRICDIKDKNIVLSASLEDRYKVCYIDGQSIIYRTLTPIECERLQTVPENYTNHVSNSQRYKMLGNGWTVKIISHIFKNIT